MAVPPSCPPIPCAEPQHTRHSTCCPLLLRPVPSSPASCSLCLPPFRRRRACPWSSGWAAPSWWGWWPPPPCSRKPSTVSALQLILPIYSHANDVSCTALAARVEWRRQRAHCGCAKGSALCSTAVLSARVAADRFPRSSLANGAALLGWECTSGILAGWPPWWFDSLVWALYGITICSAPPLVCSSALSALPQTTTWPILWASLAWPWHSR